MMQQFNPFLKTIVIVAGLAVMVFYVIPGQQSANARMEFTPTHKTLGEMKMVQADAEPLTPNLIQPLKSIDKPTYDRLVAMSLERPVYMMIYASWCPHCKRMFGVLNEVQKRYGDKMYIAAISIDNNEQQARRFVSSIQPRYLDSYRIDDAVSYDLIVDDLRSYGLSFKGGVGKSTGVPYNAVFYQAEPVAEFAGALPEAELKRVIAEIVSHAEKQ